MKMHGAMLASVIMMVYNKHITTIAFTHVITQPLTRSGGFFFICVKLTISKYEKTKTEWLIQTLS